MFMSSFSLYPTTIRYRSLQLNHHKPPPHGGPAALRPAAAQHYGLQRKPLGLGEAAGSADGGVGGANRGANRAGMWWITMENHRKT